MYPQPGRHLLVDVLQELLELGRPMPAVGLFHHLATGQVEGGEEGGGAMTFVVMRTSLRQSRSHRQNGLGAVQGLDLTFLVHAEHGGRLRRVQIEPGDVPHLVHEQRVVGDLEGVGAMRLKFERMPDALYAAPRQPDLLGHPPRRPVRGVPRLLLQGLDQHSLDHLASDRGRHSRAVLIGQPRQKIALKATAPLAHRLRRGAHLPGHRLVGLALGTGEHDPRAHGQGLRGARAACPSLQRLPLLTADFHRGGRSASSGCHDHHHHRSPRLFNPSLGQETRSSRCA